MEELEKVPEVGVEVEGKGCCMTVTQDGLADAKLVGAAMIPEVMLSPTRMSPRLAGVAAEHTLVRAERLVQSRNLECNKGNKSTDPSCFSSISKAVDNLRMLGLGVGSNICSSFEMNVQNLVEGDLVCRGPGSVLGTEKAEFSDVDSVESEGFERKTLEFLCQDLMEEIFDDDSYHLSSDLKTVQRKPGAKSSRKRASRKMKIRINKISAK